MLFSLKTVFDDRHNFLKVISDNEVGADTNALLTQLSNTADSSTLNGERQDFIRAIMFGWGRLCRYFDDQISREFSFFSFKDDNSNGRYLEVVYQPVDYGGRKYMSAFDCKTCELLSPPVFDAVQQANKNDRLVVKMYFFYEKNMLVTTYNKAGHLVSTAVVKGGQNG